VSTKLRTSLRHSAWTPSILIGAALAAFAIPFIPQPVAHLPEGERADRVRWAGPVALSAAAALLLGFGYVFGVPLIRELGVISIAMLASNALPVRPLDGGYIHRRSTGIVVTLLLAAVSAVILLAWI
jgi:Zn-dependent protease